MAFEAFKPLRPDQRPPSVRSFWVVGLVSGQVKAKMNKCDPLLEISLRKSSEKIKTTVDETYVAYVPHMRISHPLTLRPSMVPFFFDPNHVNNQIASVCHRVGREMRKCELSLGEQLLAYAKCFIIKYCPTLTSDEVPTVAEWLVDSNYSEGRKKQLLKLYVKRDWERKLTKNILLTKSFIKHEGYRVEDKQPRGIHSYTDMSKVVLGPLCHAVDKKTFFSLKWFVKGTNPKDWPAKLKSVFGDSPVLGTDFSSFEAHHRGVLAQIGRFWMMHMLRGSGASNSIKRLISRMMTGTNTMKYSKIVVKLEECLMSGALWTSSQNGMLNLILMSFLNGKTKYPNKTPAELADCVDDFFTGFVEGDDGICLDQGIDKNLIERLGLELKFDKFPNFSQASFCGIVCDVDELKVVSDPVKILRNFFVLPIKYAKASEFKQKSLLRAKALSYKYNLNDCPVVGALCQWVCDQTKSIDVTRALSEIDSWKRATVIKACEEKIWRNKPEVSMTSRLLVEKNFGVSICEQLWIEEQILLQSANSTLLLDLDALTHSADFNHVMENLRLPEEGIQRRKSCKWTDPQITKFMNPVPLTAKQKRARNRLKRCRQVDEDFDNVRTEIILDPSAVMSALEQGFI